MSKKRVLYLGWMVCVLLVGSMAAIGTNRFLDYKISKPFALKAWGVSADKGAVEIPGDLEKIISLSEFFGHGYGIFVICAIFFCLDVSNRRKLLRIISCLLLTSACVQLVKSQVFRSRPFSTDFRLSSFYIDPLREIQTVGNSFPSGHTAIAFALALMFSSMYPKGKYLFFLLAILAATERVVSARHFPSDTIVGAMIGYVVYCLCFKIGFLPGLFQRFEVRKSKAEANRSALSVSTD